MNRDSCPNFWYKEGLEAVRSPVRRWFGVQSVSESNLPIRASDWARRGACAVGRGIA